MNRKMKSKKKQFSKRETDGIRTKPKKRLPKEKYTHFKSWLDEEIESREVVFSYKFGEA